MYVIRQKVRRYLLRGIGYFYLLVVYYVWFKFLCRGEIVGEEVVRRNLEKGFVLAANHVSGIDPPVLFGYFYFRHRLEVTFLSGQRNYKDWLSRGIHEVAGAVKIRDSAAVFNTQSMRHLHERQVVGIFPEGGRSPDGFLRKGKAGAIYIAAKLNRPIVPVALQGFYDAWPKTRRFPRPVRCRIVFGEEMFFQDARGAEYRNIAAETHIRKVMMIIAGLLGQRYRY